MIILINSMFVKHFNDSKMQLEILNFFMHDMSASKEFISFEDKIEHWSLLNEIHPGVRTKSLILIF